MINLGISLVAFRGVEEVKNFLRNLKADTNLLPIFEGFELSYNLSKELLERLSFLKGRIMSVHAPCPETEIYPNLGTFNLEILEDSLSIIRQSAETAVKFGAKRVVLHPGYTLDVPVYTDFKRRNAAIKRLIDAEKTFALMEGKTFSNASYRRTENYRKHLEASFKNLGSAVSICNDMGLELAIENLNPRLTYLYQSPDDILEAVERVNGIKVCLDLGHLWISSLVYDLDFLSVVEYIASTGTVVSVHVHDNNSRFPDYLADEHLPPGRGVIPITGAVNVLKARGVSNFVLECVEDGEEGLKFLIDGGLIK